MWRGHTTGGGGGSRRKERWTLLGDTGDVRCLLFVFCVVVVVVVVWTRNQSPES